MSDAPRADAPSQPEVVGRVLALKTLEVFSHLEPAELSPLADRLEAVDFAAGQLVLSAEAPVTSVVFVLEGAVRERRHGAAPREVGPRAVLGLADLLAGTSGGVEARAASEGSALRASRETLLAAMEDAFPVQQAILRALAGAALDAAGGLGEVSRGSRPSSSHARDGEADLAGRILALRRTALLRGVQVHTLGQIALDAGSVVLEPGQALWRRGDSADHALLLLAGGVALASEGGRGAEVEPGALLGIEECLAGRRRAFDAAVERRGRALRIDVESLLDALEDDPDVALDLTAALAAQVTARLDRQAAGLRHRERREESSPAPEAGT